MTITSAMDNFMANFCLFQSFNLADCLRGKQGSRMHFCGWLFSGVVSRVIAYSFVVCLHVLGLKVDLQWALDRNSFQSSWGFELKIINWIDFGIPVWRKNKDFKTIFDFLNLFMSFCTKILFTLSTEKKNYFGSITSLFT